MTYTYLVSAKKRTTLQKVFAGFMVLSLNLSMGGAMAFVAPSVASADVTPTTIFSDGFEAPTGLGNWTAGNAWKSSNSGHSGSKSAEVNGGNDNQTMSTTSSIAVFNPVSFSFWFKADDLEDGSGRTSEDHVYVEYSTGSGWVRVKDINSNVDDKVWRHSGTTTVTGATSLTLRFVGDLSSGKDFVWIDDVLISGTPITYTLQVATSGTGSGSVTSAPVGISCGADCAEAYNSGTTVVLTQSANSGSTFGTWSGCDSFTATTCTVNMSGNKTVNASFAVALVPENTDARCADGIDNDGDGTIDLADNDCRGGLTVTKTVVNGPYNANPSAFTLKVCPTTAPIMTLLGVKTAYASPVADPCITVTSDALTFLEPGWYQVTENPVVNYGLVYTSGQCNSDGKVYVGRGDNDTCGMTNTYDICPNIAGNQPEVPAGRVLNNDGQCVPVVVPACADNVDNDGDGLIDESDPGCTSEVDNDESNTAPTACEENISTLTVVSDATNNVVETAAPAVGTWVHSAWTNIVGSTWIWGTPEVLAPTTQETETFTKTFSVTGTVTGASLELAADNDYVVWVNGTQVASSTPEAAGYNFGSVTTVSVPTTLFVQGANEIKMQVTNLAYNGDSHANPAGALYKLTITKNACTPTPAPVCDPEVNLLSNGDFEAPVVSGWDIIPFTNSALKWLGAFVAPQDGGRLGLELQASVAGSPFAGVQHAELDGDHPVKIWQNVPLMPGYDYELSTMYSPRPGSNAADNTLQFQLNGVALGANVARDGSTNANTLWTKESRTFTAGAASADVGFAEVGTDSSIGVFLDNASLRCVQKHVPAATIVATKVVCDNESDLPNWSGTGQVIDANTATSYVSQKEGACRIVPDWKFQWAPTSANNPGDNTGEAADWHTFVSSVSVALGDMTSVWMREVYDAAYIPFTHSTTQRNVSAEMYCNGDVLNYDNLDYARNLTDGGTVYCVAFNVLKKEVPPTDVCPNLEGSQSVLPEGMMLVEGQCVETTPSITVVKHVENNNGGTKQASDFTIRVNVPEEEEEEMALLEQVKDFFSTKTAFAGEMIKMYAPASFSGSEEGTTIYFRGATEFNVVEPEHPGYDVTYSEDCRGTISLGEHLTCIVTNDDKSQGGGGGTGSTDTPYPGCMNPEATNFNRLANRDDGSCQLPQSQQPTGGETAPQGEVLGAATTEPDLSLPASCGEYLSDYLRYGKKNNPEQVKLLQSFLNEYVEANLPVTGFFGKMTHNAVKKFQVKYHAEIIKPWIDAGYKDKDIENGTGYVFKTTKREINLLKCSSLNIPMPELKAE